jgi:LuxR family transcriptional regulator, maltose regulon positive regulatory protein
VSQVKQPAPSLIRTKLNAPVARELVSRTALLEVLCGGSPRRLTLVRAPAGWGKSSLLADWHAADRETRPFAWLSLDRGDNDPVRFFGYAIEALRLLAGEIGQRSAEVLRAPGVSLVDDVLPVLLNELEALPGASVLLVEDYHLITSAEVHEAVAFLLEHAPAQLELVLSTRGEPPLPLARLRARGELLEIAAPELRFSAVEAEALFNRGQMLGLDAGDVSRLLERTEGWPAGLYMAALSLRGHGDSHEFIKAFAGDDRHVVDYLTAEVLAGQPEDLREFLLTTSVLDRLCAPLCDAVTGHNGSATLLRRIEGSNLFLVPLDTRREWYRYHHLFGELLRNELAVTDPKCVTDGHRRAAAWLLEHGFVSDAIHHTIAAGDGDAAGALVAASWFPIATSGGDHTVQRWLDALPGDVHENDARLCVARTVVSISLGQLDEVEPQLQMAAQVPAAGPFQDGFASAAAAVGTLRTVHRWLIGDLGGCREAARRAAKSIDGPSPWDAVTFTWLGSSTYWLGESEAGISALEEGLERGRAAAFYPAWVSALGLLALIRVEQGDLAAAEELASTALHVSDDAGLAEYWVRAPAHVARGSLLLHAGRTSEAEDELERGVELARRGSGPVEGAHALVALAQARQERGDRDRARGLLAEARWTLQVCPDPGPVVTALLEMAERRLRVSPRRGAAAAAVEEFSDREVAVLRLLSSELSQREIGGALYISFNTVKTHSKNIYRKLGVSQRADSVTRARELELL